ncbi:AAA domain-containing protein [Mesosutterella sp. AGMB02718]|uniref:AAA domain-containing protein n=1 Tax=Mesosutterella faecium TaxID=2925194 RepID=A0ABT7IQE8_9BURK|nr:AAA domain-containing protein [Mesosutterella sp. AGMB02718]MDL2060123.1 AAA domain-containing protein [Mesosutterella sp. AGMB02718]
MKTEEPSIQEKKQAVKSFLSFAGEFSKLREHAVLRLDKYEWSLYPDKIDPSLQGIKLWSGREDDDVLLSVERQQFPKPPSPSVELENWIDGDWRSPNWKKTFKPSKDEVSFEENPSRVEERDKWLKAYSVWQCNYLRASEANKYFDRLYSVAQLIESSGMRLMACAGSILFVSDDAHGSIYHPIDVQAVNFHLDTSGKNPRIFLTRSTEEKPVFRTDIFSAIENADFHLDGCAGLRAALQDGLIHPFDPGEFINDFKKFANSFSKNSAWMEKDPDFQSNIFYGLMHRPAIWVQNRPSGVEEAVRGFLDGFDKGRAEIPQFLIDLTSGLSERKQSEEQTGVADEDKTWCEDSGFDEKIFLTKPANAEQLRIARLLERSPGVLVQGPPGTGKTHTIANVIGHLLATGKKVLVTSQKPQALAVLKSKLPEALRPLCISDTGDKNDIQDTVRDFTNRVSELESVPSLLEKKIQQDLSARHDLIQELREKQKKLFALAHQEVGTQVFDGESWSISDLGKWLHENENLANKIPFQAVGTSDHFPLTDNELKELYGTASQLPREAEKLLCRPLPQEADLPATQSIFTLHQRLKVIAEKINSLNVRLAVEGSDALSEEAVNKYDFPGFSVCVPSRALQALIRLKPVISNPALRLPPDHWARKAAAAGIMGGGMAAQWESLSGALKKVCEAATQYSLVANTLPVQIHDSSQLPVILKAMDELSQAGLEGEPNFLNKLLHRSAYAALDAVKVNKKSPRTNQEFEAVRLYADLMSKRESARRLWSLLIEKGGDGPAYDDFGAEYPEFVIYSQVLPLLDQAIKWWPDQVVPLAKKLLSLGLKADILSESQSLILEPDRFVVQFDDFVFKSLSIIVEIEECRSKEREFRAQLNHAADSVLKNSSQSPLLPALADGILHDANAYLKTVSRVRSLAQLVPVAERRKSLLVKLEQCVPEWASALRERRPGFDENSECPEQIQDAWKWLKLNNIFKQYLLQNPDVLQRDIETLSDRFRQLTSKLVSEMAWSHTVGEVSGTKKMQKLVAWLQIVKKIGKGTGKNAERYRACARETIKDCGDAVPVWIMPIGKALNAFTLKNQFDVVIVDEASQSDITTAPVLVLGKKVLIVGDDEQVSPLSIGVKEESFKGLVDQFLKGRVINWRSYFPQTSLYDLAKTTCKPLMLREHFRCVPEIIGFCNQLSYGGNVLPLRDASMSRLKPAIVPWRVDGERRPDDSNIAEAHAISKIIQACIQQPEYDGKTFGVIVMISGARPSKGQVACVNDCLLETVGAGVMKERHIRVGLSADFQGDERDVILLSLVDSPASDGAALRTVSDGANNSQKQRWNVAVSRARDQLWLVHSFDPNTQLSQKDIRRKLFEWASAPWDERISSSIETKADSQFEIDVVKALLKRGYSVEQQHHAGNFFIDIVVRCGGKKIALECDGDAWHSDEDQIENDLKRQAILERMGWKFIRLRGGEFYRDPKAAIDRVCNQLNEQEIFPFHEIKQPAQTTELLERIKAAVSLLDNKDESPNTLANVQIEENKAVEIGQLNENQNAQNAVS